MDSIKILGISEFEKSNFVKPFRVEFSQNGLVRNWDCVKVHSSVSCLLYHEEKDAFLLVKQFRPAVWHSLKYLANLDEQTAINRAFTYELCAGITDKNLSEIDTMREEILEETGYKVDKISKITSVYGGLGFAASKQSMFYGVINESMRVNSGGGVDDESIELVFLKRENVREFAFDESKVKAAGLLFALIWFFKGKRW